MSRCIGCEFTVHDQFEGHNGRWMCLHPCRNELSNRGTFTFPRNTNPTITICKTAASDYNDLSKHIEVLYAAKTPVWCYFEAVERAKKRQPGFDPDVQRAILWPNKKTMGCGKSSCRAG